MEEPNVLSTCAVRDLWLGRGGVLLVGARECRAVHSAFCGGGADVALHVAGEEPFEQLTVAARRQQPGLENEIRVTTDSSSETNKKCH